MLINEVILYNYLLQPEQDCRDFTYTDSSTMYSGDTFFFTLRRINKSYVIKTNLTDKRMSVWAGDGMANWVV